MSDPQESGPMSMDRTAERPPVREQSRSQLARLLAMFHSPGAVFRSIAVAPTVTAVLIAIGLAGAVGATAVSRATDRDAAARHFLEQREQAGSRGLREMSEAQRERLLETMRSGARRTRNFATILGGLGAVVVPLVASALFLLGFGVLGSGGSYRTILSTVTHAWWPPAAVSSVLHVIVVWISWPMDPERASSPLRTSLAALAPDLEGAAMVIARRVDLFLGWEIALLGLGFATTLGVSRKISFGAALALWAFGTAVAVARILTRAAFTVTPA